MRESVDLFAFSHFAAPRLKHHIYAKNNIKSGSLTLILNVSCNLMITLVMSLIVRKGFNVGIVLLMPECLAEMKVLAHQYQTDGLVPC